MPIVPLWRREAIRDCLTSLALAASNRKAGTAIIDTGNAQNGCPGEALTPPEIFLAGVITCGVELVQVFARDKNLSLRSATGIISATLDRSNQARSDVTLFNSVRLDFTLTGVSHDEGHQLVDAFKARCPLYGTLAVATPKVDVNVSTQK